MFVISIQRLDEGVPRKSGLARARRRIYPLCLTRVQHTHTHARHQGSIEQRCLYVTAKTTNPANTPLYKADVYGNVLDSKGKGAVDKCKSSANVCGTGKMGFAPTIPVGEGEITISIPMVRSRDLEEALQQKGIDELNIFGFYAKGVAGRKPPVQPGASGTRYGVNTGEADLTQECEEFGIGCDDEVRPWSVARVALCVRC